MSVSNKASIELILEDLTSIKVVAILHMFFL